MAIIKSLWAKQNKEGYKMASFQMEGACYLQITFICNSANRSASLWIAIIASYLCS